MFQQHEFPSFKKPNQTREVQLPKIKVCDLSHLNCQHTRSALSPSLQVPCCLPFVSGWEEDNNVGWDGTEVGWRGVGWDGKEELLGGSVKLVCTSECPL